MFIMIFKNHYITHKVEYAQFSPCKWHIILNTQIFKNGQDSLKEETTRKVYT